MRKLSTRKTKESTRRCVSSETSEKMSNNWQNGTFGCFSDIGTCCFAYFCPCIVAGKNAEAMGENCCLYGFLSTLGCIGLFTQSTIRQKIRERYGIEVGT